MTIIHEYRVVLNMHCEEYQVAQLYSVAEASKENTGGGEGIEVIKNEPFDCSEGSDCPKELKPDQPLCANGMEFEKGQYTHKIYHLQSKVPALIRKLAPKGSLEIHEKAWNAYPYCRTVITNPDYMKENFIIKIETMHYPDNGQMDNIHRLEGDELKKRMVNIIDIANDIPENSKDYKKEFDPSIYKSEKTGRGPLKKDWIKNTEPVMCAYKLVTIRFKWWGLQGHVENFIDRQECRLFTTFHRQVHCWTDKWYGLTMSDIRALEDRTKHELDEQRAKGKCRGMTADE